MSRGEGGTLLVAFAGLGLAALVADHMTTPFDAAFDAAAQAHDVSPNLLRALARRESSFNPNVVSPANRNGTRDYGLMQINERTAHDFHVDPKALLGSPTLSADLAARVLAQDWRALGAHANTINLISAYNAGAGAVLKHGITNPEYVAIVHWHLTLYTFGRLLA